jgi:RsiW-degrading membrane proteinase PrsW (M82 family)
MLLLDFYVFQVIKALSSGSTEKTKLTIYSIYWLISIAAVALMVLMPYLNYESWPKNVRAYVFATIVGLFFAKLVAAIFFLLDDVRRALMWIMGKVFPGFFVYHQRR